MKNNFIGIILAAGRGSRMLKKTRSKPKCMTEIVKNKTLLDFQIENLNKIGIKKIYVITGYRQDQIKGKGIIKIVNKQWRNTNMIYTLLKANHLLKKYKCIISYSDIIYGKDIIKKLTLSNKNNLYISYDPNWKSLWSKRFKNPLSDAESFKIDKKYNIKNIGDKETSIKNIQGQFMGLLKTNPKIWKKIITYLNYLNKDKIKKLQTTHLLNDLITKKILNIKGVKNNSNWCEVDTQSDLKVAKKYLKVNKSIIVPEIKLKAKIKRHIIFVNKRSRNLNLNTKNDFDIFKFLDLSQKQRIKESIYLNKLQSVMIIILRDVLNNFHKKNFSKDIGKLLLDHGCNIFYQH